MTSLHKAPKMRSPQQVRSEKTLRRFLGAAEELLEEGTFDDVAITEICLRADRSVGAFYARFENKEALFGELRRRTLTSLSASFTESLETSGWRRLELPDRVRKLVATVADLYAGHRGVMRSLALRARSRSDHDLEQEGPRINESMYERAAVLLEDRLPHLAPEACRLRARFGLSVVAASLREHILFDEIGLSPVDIDRDGLVEELTRVLLSYLSAPEGVDLDPSAS